MPKGSLGAQATAKDKDLDKGLSRIEKQVASLNGRIDQSMQSILEIRQLIAATLKQNEIQSSRLSEIATKSSAVSDNGVVVSHSCLQQPPIQIVAFDIGSASVDDPYLLDRLELLSQHLQEKPQEKIILAGFADKSGTSSFNNRLSRLRAQRIAEKLEKFGINTARLVQIGMGENQTTDYPERRVEIRSCDLK